MKKKDEDKRWILDQERQYSDKVANEKANKKAAKLLLASFDALYESSDEEEDVVVVAPTVPKVVVPKVEPRSTKYMDALLQAKPAVTVEVKPKVVKAPVKINWATAETDSEGDESDSEM
jgi:hypothetical protein